MATSCRRLTRSGPPDVQKQNEDLMVEFWKSDMAPADAHAKWVEILKIGSLTLTLTIAGCPDTGGPFSH